MPRPSPAIFLIRVSLYVAAVGGAVFCLALVTGLLKVIPAGAAVGVGGAGLVLWAVGLRQFGRAVRMRKRERVGEQ